MSIPPSDGGNPAHELTVPELIALITESPYAKGAELVAGVYGAYSSYIMAQAMERLADLEAMILSGLDALRIEIEQLYEQRTIDDAVAKARGAVISIGHVEDLNDIERGVALRLAISSVDEAVEKLADWDRHPSFAFPFAMCASLQAEILKRQTKYSPPTRNELIDALNTTIGRGNSFLGKLEGIERDRVGKAFLGPVPVGIMRGGYTLDGQVVVVYQGMGTAVATIQSRIEAARTAKVNELLGRLENFRVSINAWTRMRDTV
jgi:hypothetical protein